MPSTRLRTVFGTMLVALTFTGCIALVPREGVEPGWRRFIVAVNTLGTDRPAILLVADDSGRIVGRAVPNVVAPHKQQPVTFDVPPGRSWKIFVNGEVFIVGTDDRVPMTIFSGGPGGPRVEWAAPESAAP